MKKYYRVRLFQVIGERYPNANLFDYDVASLGEILVAKKRNKCKELFSALEVPIVNGALDTYRDNNDDMEYESIPLGENDRKHKFIIVSSDFNDNREVKSDAIQGYAVEDEYWFESFVEALTPKQNDHTNDIRKVLEKK